MGFAEKPNYQQYNNCDHLINHFEALSVLQSALLWCGIPKNEIPQYERECKPKGQGSVILENVFIHPYISCVEPRCRILHQAFDDGLLKMGRDGKKGDYIFGEKGVSSHTNTGVGHIALPRRTIVINDLKAYIQEFHPNDMPKTLFSTIEINKSQPISNDDYLALTAKLEAQASIIDDLEARLKKAREIYINQKNEIEFLQTSKVNLVNENTENSYLTTIGLLLELLKTPKGFDKDNKPNKPLFDSNAQIIQAITELDLYGQGKSTLENRFSKANIALDQAKKK